MLYRRLQPLGHELPRAVYVSAVVKLERNLRQAEFRQRTHFLEPRKSGHFDFYRPGDESLGFFRRQGSHLGVDLDLHASDVRNRVNRETSSRPETDANQRERGE